jgi:hypothetical protein
MQNPLAQFSEARKILPNQLHPGTGAGKEMWLLLHDAAVEHGRLLMCKPEAFHNALMYQHHGMRFASPHCQVMGPLTSPFANASIRLGSKCSRRIWRANCVVTLLLLRGPYIRGDYVSRRLMGRCWWCIGQARIGSRFLLLAKQWSTGWRRSHHWLRHSKMQRWVVRCFPLLRLNRCVASP